MSDPDLPEGVSQRDIDRSFEPFPLTAEEQMNHHPSCKQHDLIIVKMCENCGHTEPAEDKDMAYTSNADGQINLYKTAVEEKHSEIVILREKLRIATDCLAVYEDNNNWEASHF